MTPILRDTPHAGADRTARGPGRLLVLPALVLAAACGHEQRPRSDAAPPSAAPVAVRTAEVVRSEGPGRALVPASVHAVRHATLASRIAASVTELPFREGEHVPEGAVVVRLDDSALRSALQAAEAASQAADTDLRRAEALLERGAATPRERDEAASRAAAARAGLEAVRDNLTYAVLRSPFAGRLARRSVDVGDVVSPGLPLAEVEASGGLEVRATVDSEVARMLAPGTRVSAEVDGQAEPLEARIRSIAPAADPTTHRLEVRADLPARAGVRAGLFARLIVPGPEGPARLMVPREALVTRGGLTGVFVVADGVARLRWIAVGAADANAVEARAGVEAGERVVLDPGDLADGALVTGAR